MNHQSMFLAIIFSLKFSLKKSEDKISYQFFSGLHFEIQLGLIPYEAVIPLILTETLNESPKPIESKSNVFECKDDKSD